MHAMRPGAGRCHPSRPATWGFADVPAEGDAFRRPMPAKSASQPRFFAAISRNRADGRRLPSWSRRPRRRLRSPPRDAHTNPRPPRLAPRVRPPLAQARTLRPSPRPTHRQLRFPPRDAHPAPAPCAAFALCPARPSLRRWLRSPPRAAVFRVPCVPRALAPSRPRATQAAARRAYSPSPLATLAMKSCTLVTMPRDESDPRSVSLFTANSAMSTQ